jgi:hypothetical protein
VLIAAVAASLGFAASAAAAGVNVAASEELTEGGFEFIESTPAAVAFLTIQAVPSADGTDVVLYRDGWRVGTLAGGSTRVAVHAGDVLALQLRLPVRVSVGARGAVASPEGWWALSPATPARRLPLVVLRQGMGGMV